MILHDANRTNFHFPAGLFASEIRFTDYRSWIGVIWIARKDSHLEDLFDTRLESRLWNLYSVIGQTAVGRFFRP